MQSVMLKRNWPASNFNRTLKDEAGKPVTFTFNNESPVELEDFYVEQLAANGDLGRALDLVNVDGKSRPRPVAARDPNVTDAELLEAISDDALLAELHRRGIQPLVATLEETDGDDEPKAKKPKPEPKAKKPKPEPAADDAPLGDFDQGE